MKGEWVKEKGIEIFGQFFPGSWEACGDGIYQGHCPGAELHSKGSAEADCRIYCGYGPRGESPGAFCFHSGCSGVLKAMNDDFRGKLFEKSGKARTAQAVATGVAQEPQGERKAMNKLYSEERLREVTAGTCEVSPAWFMERSPKDPRGVMPAEFLESIFDPGERAIVFTKFTSQGDFAWEVGRGGFRLGKNKGISAVKSRLPIDGGADGVWFLSNPVSLKWEFSPRKKTGDGTSRRIKECVTSWKYLVLESDDAPAELWLKFLAKMPDCIRAIYSSGGRSWHALVCVYAPTWAHMDGLLQGNPHGANAGQRMGAKRMWAELGADPGALTPVRLTRLPGCTRGGKQQRLIYLNPGPDGGLNEKGEWNGIPIVDLPKRREVG
jgi:hypothetical protein